MKNRVIVLMGPAGAGKSSVASYIEEKWGIPQVITHTTRAKRIGETDGVDYYFESKASFETKHFLESVNYGGHRYGSSIEGLKRGFEKAPFVSIVLDTKGGQTYEERLGEQAWLWYVTVSNVAELRSRLIARGDDEKAIVQRLSSAEFKRDLALPKAFENKALVIKNDDWEKTKQAIDAQLSKEQND
ncbi:guanylate kinase [Fructobacillus sp. M1-13]|uniref:Guanylate kinase n=1 Tax=Fructobacillus papyriferae TaxID=2713171 RepID=A0ABS5QQZ5_9LACO|nr:guanylate kinase [Fructobacillus papyriferae]MBS9335623.1 guanylate kinase [Fructobacillus papyriferae]MCD2159288.1 guanylate kinase [Fructobacillus papyriferae]